MKELIFSISNKATGIREMLNSFNRKRPADKQVQLQEVPWAYAKQELTAMALYSRGIDVSQVGGPFVDDLIAMRALRPYTDREIESMGGPSAFSKVAWENAHRTSEGLIYAIPWVIDPRVIFYWRVPLEEAGIDGASAFQTFEQMETTLQRLQAVGYETPLFIPFENSLLSLQIACTWIWGAGGDIGDEKGLSILDPNSLRGLRKFLSLNQFIAYGGKMRGDDFHDLDSFKKRKSLVTFGNLAIYYYMSPKTRAQIGVALGPGPFFVGSSNLVIWQSSKDEEDAMSLVRYLTGAEAQQAYCERCGFLPAHLGTLKEPPFSTDPVLQTFIQSANSGRSWAAIRMGGLLEDLLANAFQRIWIKVFANPNTDLETAVIEEVEPIVQRISLWNE